MIRTFFFYAAFAIILILYIPNLIILKSLKGKISESEFAKLAEKHTSKFSSILIKISGAKIHITGQENIPENEAVLFVSNHQSNFDTALFLACIRKPKGYIAKKELSKVPLLNSWMKQIRCVFMDRNDMRNQMQSILQGIEILKSGHSMVVFPEGTRSKGDTMAEFKSGSFKLATKSQVKIVPVTISGSYKLMEVSNNSIQPADVYITIHEIVDTVGLSKEELNDLPTTVRNTIQKGLSQ